MTRTVAIIRTGTANLASVQAALDRLSIDNRVVGRPEQLLVSDALILPGVGSFAAGVDAIHRSGWAKVLTDRFQENLPTLAVCLGLQLLAPSSEEAPGREGLGLLPVPVARFPANVCSPQLGWNHVQGAGALVPSGFAYFANSFCLQEVPHLRAAGWHVATATHGIEFAAAIQRGNWLACQFHPELSGNYGRMLLQNWLAAIDTPANACHSEGKGC